MIYKRFDNKLVIRLNKGEKFVETVREILNKENIFAASISAIGATNDLDVGVYDPDKKQYNKKIFKEDLEITSILGNISQKDGNLYTHFHITCGRTDATTISGHLNEAVISLTAEIVIDIINGVIDRVYDEETGLNLINF